MDTQNALFDKSLDSGRRSKVLGSLALIEYTHMCGGVVCGRGHLQGWGQHSYVPVALGFLSGGVLLQATDWWLSRMQGSLEELDLYKGLAVSDGSGVVDGSKASKTTQLRRLLLLIIAITIHNFPEGMAVGVAFGAIGSAPG